MREIDYKTLKVGNKVVTRDGREGRILCKDLKDNKGFCIACAIINQENTHEHINLYRKNGGFSEDINTELNADIFLPPQIEKLEIYQWENGVYFISKIGGIVDIPKGFESMNYKHIKSLEIEL